ncbi:MAG: 30S ribosomal protein S11 [Candidatus Parcubacteria bacterium]|nr:MAG: 30S ribosomal protein S11 [Candidatus Parcubacteria bacterium]
MGKTRTKLVEGSEIKDKKKAGGKKIKKKYLDLGVFYINANLNNTIITFTNLQGDVLKWTSAGSVGFKNTKKATPYAAARAAENIINLIKENFSVNDIKVIIKGIGPGRESALRVIFNSDFNVISVEDRTPIPFGGPTPPKPRSV